MKNYTITVNGNVYDVTVEEKVGGEMPAQRATAPTAPVATSVQKQTSAAGNIEVKAGAAGKVFKVEASVGQKVAKGDTIIVVEAMKMEIPVVAPEDGTVASIDVAVGDAVEAGAVMATLN